MIRKPSEFEKSYRPVAFWLIAAAVLLLGATMLKPFIAALAWAIVLSVLTYGPYQRLKVRMGENLAATATVIGTFFVVVIPLVLVGLMLYTQLNGYVGEFTAQTTNGAEKPTVDSVLLEAQRMFSPIAENLGAKLDLVNWFHANQSEVTKSLQGAAAKVLVTVGTGTFTLVVALLTMFFMLRDGHRLRQPAIELLPFDQDRAADLFARMAATIHAVFLGVLLVAIVQSGLATILYWACGVPSPLIFGVATFVLCTIPLLGGPVVYAPLGLLLLAQGHTGAAIALWAVGFGVISNVDNILRPFIIGARVQMHPIGVFFSLLGGVLLFGPVGIMVGPVVLTALVGLQDVIRNSRQSLEPVPAAPDA